MCGIAGYIGERRIDVGTINSTLALMSNRGPDFQDFSQHQFGNKNIYLLHSRLSIIDLEPHSNQPFKLEHCEIVFNGEIYNYLELRTELEKRSIPIRTGSDTEILLHYYLLYGTNCVEYFNGMWAFAILDKKENHLFISRDRFSEKPLYIFHQEHAVYFGSEPKFIRSLYEKDIALNYDKMRRYLANGYKCLYKDNETYYSEIEELEYACNILIKNDLSTRHKWRYWEPKYLPDEKISLDCAVEGIRERLVRSVELRLRADVPIAFCLSGGIDSSALVSITTKFFNKNVHTYSIIDKDPRYDESINIQATVDDTDCLNTSIQLRHEHTLDRLSQLIRYHDGPISTITYLVHSLLSEKISADGIRVVLSGTGADEIFTGYYDHYLLHLHALRESDKFSSYLEDWQDYVRPNVRSEVLQDPYLYLLDPDYREHVFDHSEKFNECLSKPLNYGFTEERYSNSLLRNRMMNELFHEVTPVVLHEDDLNSMCFSVENRSPYLDRDLIEYMYKVPDNYLIKNGYNKYLLRQSMNGILNSKVRLDRQKRGFNASITTLLDFDRPDTKELFLDTTGDVFELVNRGEIEKLLSVSEIPNHLSKFLFSFLGVKIFLEQTKDAISMG